MMRILLAQHNSRFTFVLRAAIERMEHVVDVIIEGSEAAAAIQEQSFDLIILDSQISGINVISLIQDYRAGGGKTPLMFMGIVDQTSEGIQALDSGADDYMLWPFDIREFEARVRVLLRRYTPQKNSFLRYGPFELNTKSRTFKIENRYLKLTAREKGVIEVLLRSPEQIISKDQIMSHLFSIEEVITPAIVEKYISRLRRKMQHHNVEIKTVYGEGYLMQLKEPEKTALKKSAED